jgi:hypothetical protein
VLFFVVLWSSPSSAVKPVVLRHRVVDWASDAADPPGIGQYWVQVDPAVLQDDNAIKHATGCDSVPHRLHGHTIQCLLSAPEVTQARARGGVTHVAAVQPHEKYDAAHMHRRAKGGVRVLLLPSERAQPDDVREQLARALEPYYHVQRIGRYTLAVLDSAHHAPRHAVAHLQTASLPSIPMTRRALDLIAASPAVYWIEPWSRTLTTAAFAVPFLLNTTAALAGATLAAPAGVGELIAIGDTGCDVAHCAFGVQSAVARTRLALSHGAVPAPPTLGPGKVRGYISYLYANGGDDSYESPTTDWDDVPDGHGTHVMSLAVGVHVSGTARDASLLVLDFGYRSSGDDYLAVPHDLHTHVLEWLTTHTPARIFSASWGTDDNGYTAQCRQIDEHAWENDDFVVVVAAGNNGVEGRATVGSPATAKNILSVGATYSPEAAFAAYKHAPERWVEDDGRFPFASTTGLDTDAVASFSGRGPTADGRIKPDILVPGSPIAGARAKYGCETSIRHGTSMAAPLVAGLVARLRAAWGAPSSARVRAALVTWAHPPLRIVELGKDAAGRFMPRTLARAPTVLDYGFGVLRFGDPAALVTLAERQPMAAGDALSWVAEFDVPPGNVTVTLAWTDPPSAVHARSNLVHDLNLDVVVDGTRRVYGNHRPGVPDYVNNIERVRVAPLRTLRVTVRGARLPVGAVQPFALVTTTDRFAPVAPASTACDPAAPVDVSGEPCVVAEGGGVRRCRPDGTLEDACTLAFCFDHYVWDGHACVVGDSLACSGPCAFAFGRGTWCTVDGFEQCLLERCNAEFLYANNSCTCFTDVLCSDGSSRKCVQGLLGDCGTGRRRAGRPARKTKPTKSTSGVSTLTVFGVLGFLLLLCCVGQTALFVYARPHETPVVAVATPAAKSTSRSSNESPPRLSNGVVQFRGTPRTLAAPLRFRVGGNTSRR